MAIPEIEDVSTSLDAITTYLDDVVTYITTGTGAVDYPAAISSLIEANLLSYCTTQRTYGVGFSVGAAQDIVYLNSALKRDVDICNLKKSDIYLNGKSEFEDEITFYNGLKNYYSGLLRGDVTTGSQC